MATAKSTKASRQTGGGSSENPTIDSLFARHEADLLKLKSAELSCLEQSFRGGNGGLGIGRLCLWMGRLCLCCVALVALILTLSSHLVVSGYATQSTAWLAASDLAVQKMIRRVSHALQLYNVQAMLEIGQCIVPNPFADRLPPKCCGCEAPMIRKLSVAPANISKVANIIDALYNRAVNPFSVVGPPVGPPAQVDFARLAAFVTETTSRRDAFKLGIHEIDTLPPVDSNAPRPTQLVRRFDDLFPADPAAAAAAELPPSGQIIKWFFGHLPAIRALRHLVPRPAYFGERTERRPLIHLILAGRHLPHGQLFNAGDFPDLQMLAHVMPLSGRLTARLAPKASCCPANQQPPPQSRAVTLEPGTDLVFPTTCYELLLGRPDDSSEEDDASAVAQISLIYNGAHQARVLQR